MTDSCVFCKIIAGEMPASFVHQDEHLIAVNDVNPQAPMHVLIMPRRHVATLNDLTEHDSGLIGDMVRLAAQIAADRGVASRGYRTVFNCNSEAGQSVFHLHLHVLGGRRLGWPPG